MSNDVMKTGTTTLAIKCKDGIVLAADKRATAGNFIANKKVKKVFAVTARVVEILGKFAYGEDSSLDSW